MVCPGLETLTDTSITGVLGYPATCDTFFYAKIMLSLFLILSFIPFRRDQDKIGKGEIISSMGVSALAVIFLTLIGTGIGIITSGIFMIILVSGLVFVVLWLVTK